MRYLIILLIILFCIHHTHAQYLGFEHDGYDRTYLLHLPEGYNTQEKLPLIIAMHGGIGSAENLQNQSGLSDKADEEGFIVVYPEGVQGGLLNIRTWNAGWCCGYASSSNIDDVGFINALIDTLVTNYSIDENRIYATGMSNGGFMSYRLACELSDRIAAIAPVAASMSVTGYVPDRAVPIIHFHSYQDTSVPYTGGIGDGVSDHYNAPLDSVLNAWASLNNCQVLNDTVLNNEEYTHVTWTSCNCSADVQLYITKDGGHSWPGGTQTIIGDPPSEYINANDLMWEFFQQHSLSCELTSIENPVEINNNIKLYPNPTTGNLTIKIPENTYNYTISLYNQAGICILKEQNTNSLDLSSYPSGIYILQLQSEKEVYNRKISLVSE